MSIFTIRLADIQVGIPALMKVEKNDHNQRWDFYFSDGSILGTFEAKYQRELNNAVERLKNDTDMNKKASFIGGIFYFNDNSSPFDNPIWTKLPYLEAVNGSKPIYAEGFDPLAIYDKALKVRAFKEKLDC